MFKINNLLKVVITCLLCLTFIISSYASCQLGKNSCEYIFNQNNFDIEVEGDNINFENLEIFDIASQNQLMTNQTEIVDAFRYPGVYRVSAIPIDLSGNPKQAQSKDFIYDNAQPRPPVVKPVISENFEVKVPYTNDEVVIKDEQGEILFQEEVTSNNNLLVDSLNHQGYIEIYTKRGDLLSEPLKRFYFSEEPSFKGSLATGITLNQDKIRQINDIGVLGTSSKNFYIEGSAQGDKVIVNGLDVPVTSQGLFGTFISLNEGENTVEVVGANNEKQTFEVSYKKNNFKFTSIDITKTTNAQSALIEGKTSSNSPFLLYVDGTFHREITPENNEFSLLLEDISKKDTYIQLKGYNGATYETMIYRDFEKPSIVPVHEDEVSSKQSLAFLIKDDLGINEYSISLSLANQEFSIADFNRVGNFYELPLEDIPSGTYNYNLEVSDNFDKQTQIQNELIVNNDKLVIENFSIKNEKSNVLGNHIIIGKKKNLEIEFSFEKPIAFEHIYVDGFDQTNYEIYSDNSVELLIPANQLKSKGDIEFIFQDENKNSFSQSYTYEIKNPASVSLGVLSTPVISEEGDSKMIVGKIENSNFIDKNSFKINGIKPMWFGDNFETFNREETSIDISGYDILQRPIQAQKENTQISSIQQGPKDISSYTIGDKISLKYVFSNPNQIYFANTFGDFSNKNLYVKDNYEFPSTQLGTQAVLIEARGLSGEKSSFYSLQKIDGIKPQIYIINGDETNKLILDGTLTPVKDNYNLRGISTGDCDGEFNKNIKCITLNSSIEEIDISFEDSAGNRFSDVVQVQDLEEYNETAENIEEKIYFRSNKKSTIQSEEYIQGTYFSGSYPKSIKTSQGNCEYDEYSFVCPVKLNYGEQEIPVTITLQDNSQFQDSWAITRETLNNSIQIDSISGNNTYSFGGLTYYFGDRVIIDGSSSQETPVIIEINGREVYKDNSREKFSFNLEKDLSYEMQDVEDKMITLQAKSVDESGRETMSNKLRIMYAKLTDLLVSIVIE